MVVQMVVENLPAVQETWIQPLGQEESLEKEVFLPKESHGHRT